MRTRFHLCREVSTVCIPSLCKFLASAKHDWPFAICNDCFMSIMSTKVNKKDTFKSILRGSEERAQHPATGHGTHIAY